MDPQGVLLGLREKSVGLSKAQTRIPWREIIIREIVGAAAEQKKKEVVNIKLPTEVYQKYFADRKAAEAADIVERALEAWFRKEAPDIVQ